MWKDKAQGDKPPSSRNPNSHPTTLRLKGSTTQCTYNFAQPLEFLVQAEIKNHFLPGWEGLWGQPTSPASSSSIWCLILRTSITRISCSSLNTLGLLSFLCFYTFTNSSAWKAPHAYSIWHTPFTPVLLGWLKTLKTKAVFKVYA